mmetsp:Transcript_45606/g.120587  ORF Transcript_45606/g.120587 Transcript_45606/m.120587 type:complete len:210 (-) Transcript_45606:1321-1950(-)
MASSPREKRRSNATCPSLNPVRRASSAAESSSARSRASVRRIASRKRSTHSATSSRPSAARFLFAPAMIFLRSAMLLSKSPARSSSPRLFFCRSPTCAEACLAVDATSSRRRIKSGIASSTPSLTRDCRVSCRFLTSASLLARAAETSDESLSALSPASLLAFCSSRCTSPTTCSSSAACVFRTAAISVSAHCLSSTKPSVDSWTALVM